MAKSKEERICTYCKKPMNSSINRLRLKATDLWIHVKCKRQWLCERSGAKRLFDGKE